MVLVWSGLGFFCFHFSSIPFTSDQEDSEILQHCFPSVLGIFILSHRLYKMLYAISLFIVSVNGELQREIHFNYRLPIINKSENISHRP